jgi:hypothetical protein
VAQPKTPPPAPRTDPLRRLLQRLTENDDALIAEWSRALLEHGSSADKTHDNNRGEK